MKASTGARGVDGCLATTTRPSSPIATRSVKVPPVSMPTLYITQSPSLAAILWNRAAPRTLGQSRSDRLKALSKPTGHLVDVLASHGERWSKRGEFRAASQQQSPSPRGLLEKLPGTDMG